MIEKMLFGDNIFENNLQEMSNCVNRVSVYGILDLSPLFLGIKDSWIQFIKAILLV